MPVGAITGAASLGGAALQASATNNASKSAQDAAAQNLAFNKQVFTTAQNNLNPYIANGTTANTELSGLLGTGGDPTAATNAFNKYLDSTNYNFVKNQGLQGIQYANAPSFNSGATAKALDTYNTGLAGNALSGYESLLTGQSGQGVNAAGALNGVGVNLAPVNAAATQYGANAQGTAAATTGNAFTNALKNIGGSASSYVGGGGTFGGLFGGGNTVNNTQLTTV